MILKSITRKLTQDFSFYNKNISIYAKYKKKTGIKKRTLTIR